MIRPVYAEIQVFTQRESQLDDVTIVICKRNPEVS